jgi:hypothetical protein
MRKIFLIFIVVNIAAVACAQSFKSRSYKTGIYVFCGNELPKRFSYLVEKKMPNDTAWKIVAELKAPKSEADCRKAMLSLPPSIASFTNIQDREIKKLWQQIQSARTLDSLYAFGLDPRFQYAAGCVLLDENVPAHAIYQYRISKLERNGTITLVNEEQINFPSNSYNCKLMAVKFKPGEENIRITYAVSDTFNTAGIKLYRSKYEEKKFSEIPSNVFFTKENNRLVAQVTDAGTVPGNTYTYVGVPVDALGNEGTPADTLHIYNVVKPSDVGLIQKFDVTPKEKERGNLLEWKLKTDKGIASVDLYRSQTYDGNYKKLISLTPKQTKYFDDKDITPSRASFYYILVNNGYGNSLPSARIPAILQGNKQNLFPPQNITATRNGKFVKLSFVKLEPDTRGYYIYRATGYTAPLKQMQRMLLSSDSLLTYIDTLPESNLPEVYSYAVADVNNSYNISPLSERVSVQTSGNNLPAPSGVTAIYRGNSVFVTWKDISLINPSVTGYKLYRAEADDEGKEKEMPYIITETNGENLFSDTNISQGIRYHYYVQTVGLDTADVSSLSRNASVLIPEQTTINPGNVTAIAAQNKILIKWDLPADSSLKRIRVYRAVANQKATLIKDLPATEKQFEDIAIDVNTMYYYFITSVNSKNKEGKPTSPVSAKVRK